MPYFKSLNILFIHIPKTGGMNIENYFFYKSKEKPSFQNIISFSNDPINLKLNKHSLQHLTYLELLEYKDYFNINFKNYLRIFTVIRDPYDRLISDLLFLKIIENNSSQEYVEKEIYKYLNNSIDYDNHRTPQYKFISDENDNIFKNIIILKTEILNKDMKNMGFPDFEKFCNISSNKKNYKKYLNKNSIKMINDYYEKDFKIFNFELL